MQGDGFGRAPGLAADRTQAAPVRAGHGARRSQASGRRNHGFGPGWLWPWVALAPGGFGPGWLWPRVALALGGRQAHAHGHVANAQRLVIANRRAWALHGAHGSVLPRPAASC
jgi:hypothetical protein